LHSHLSECGDLTVCPSGSNSGIFANVYDEDGKLIISDSSFASLAASSEVSSGMLFGTLDDNDQSRGTGSNLNLGAKLTSLWGSLTGTLDQREEEFQPPPAKPESGIPKYDGPPGPWPDDRSEWTDEMRAHTRAEWDYIVDRSPKRMPPARDAAVRA
jgi:hypothetical protein